MRAVAMVTKVQKMLNSLQTSQIVPVMFPVTPTSSGTSKKNWNQLDKMAANIKIKKIKINC
jgi:hypothetical protein